MGAKPKYSKEIKIKACKDYEKGNISFANVAKMIGSSKEVVRRWYLIYKEHGIGGFDRPKGERLYCRLQIMI